ncbi:unnamed protein product [Alopecurus aequalis]
MNCTGDSLSVLLPPILYKPTAYRLLQPQLEQSSVVLGTTGGLLCQRTAFAGCRPPLLPQAVGLPRHYYTAPWGGEAVGSVQGCLFRDIIKHISSRPALPQATLLPRRYYAAPWRGQFFRNFLLHNRQPSALAKGPLLSCCFHTATRLCEDFSVPRFLFRGITPGVFLSRRYFSAPWEREILRPIRGLFFSHINRAVRWPWQLCAAPSRSVFHFARNYFGCFWKVTLAAAFINIMWSFVYHTCIVQVPYTSHTRIFHLETVPYTNRTHFVVRSPLDDREYGDSCFSYIKNNHSSEFLSPLHPDSVRVNLITAKLVPAVQRGLAIKSRDAALVHGSPCKDTTILDAVHAVESKKHGMSCITQPQTTHLDGLNCEAIVLKDDGLVGAMALSNGKILVFTGLLKNLETDAEIATIIAHEIAHVVARHWSESIIYEKWFPYPLKVHFLRRNELEADHIGMLILAAAGFDPRIAPVAVEKLVGNDIFHPSGKKRAQLLSRTRCMDEAMELYREVMSAKAP